MDSLIRSTSAVIVVGSPGFLLISGLMEPVVRAYSLIADLVVRYEGAQSRRTDMGDRSSGESLDSRRAFKTLVEKWEDRHTLDLLVLPGSVKEILLYLVKESGLGSSHSPVLTDEKTGAKSQRVSNDKWDKSSTTEQTLPNPFGTTDQWAEELAVGKNSSAKDSPFKSFFSPVGTRGRAEGAEERLLHSPEEVGEEEQLGQRETIDTKRLEKDEEQEQSSMGNKEFLLLLKFFTAMGYTEDVVKQVLARTGLKEASQILDLVQQEQDRSDQNQKTQGVAKTNNKNSVVLNQGRDQPCETEHKDDERTLAGACKDEQKEKEATKSPKDFQGEGSSELEGTEQEEDFVLGVLKKAAVSCGYTEQNITKVYHRLPDGSTHQLLLELQKEGSREADDFREEHNDIQDVMLEKERQITETTKTKPKGDIELFLPKEKRESDKKGQVKMTNCSLPIADLDLPTWTDKAQELPTSQYTSQPRQQQPLNPQTQVILPEVKGPPMPTYHSPLDPQSFMSNKQHVQTTHWPDPTMSKQNHQVEINTSNLKHSSNFLKQQLQTHAHTFTNNDLSSTKTKDKQSLIPSSSLVVTGEQRFLEGLQTPFELKLTDEPGDIKLRTIIIDGSNVAMSHGLGHFFSCRGIALAIQHFWDRGHRHISALVPQWRQKSDPRIKEKHYLTELQKLGLLSYTPSREVQGKRISSYDDRLILQLAHKTDGVIVTNDNLRDLSDESSVWRDIIKKRLLQYTFVGDLFMVPDDPLGRGGPHLDDFLRSEHRTPDPGNHSFAGLATPFFSTKPPRSQTEVLNFRDRTPGGALVASGGGGRGRGKVHGKGWNGEPQHRHHGGVGGGMTVNLDRTTEETAGFREQLLSVFPGQDNMVTLVLQCHQAERDINVLSDLILEQQKD
ncbi:NEDD4-binding protein 1 isoform X2 [Kryptolebias marmoratus]|nr:NEDD4-binding protein 1 isoform X2 [Kryptolebias marmoratus]